MLVTDTLVANHIVTSSGDVSDVSVVPSPGVTVHTNNSKILNSSLVCISVNVSFSNPAYYPGTAPPLQPLPLLTISDPKYWPLTNQTVLSYLTFPGAFPVVIEVNTNGQISLVRAFIGPGAPPNLPNLLTIFYNL